jgi:two-component system sensor histidine kinase DesK
MSENALEASSHHLASRWASQAGEASETVAASGISLRLWRLYAQFWLVCLLFPILFLAQTPMAPVRLALAIAGLVGFVAAYTWFMWPHPAGPRPAVPGSRPRVWLLAGLGGLVLVLSLSYGFAFLWLIVGLSAVAGVALAPRRAFVSVMGLTLITLVLGIGLSGGLARTDWLHLVPLVLLVRGLGLDLAGLTRLSEALHELHRARSELARQAVTEERLRLARDLHDLLGRTLSLITLKSELAGRLVEKDPNQATQEIREVEQAARRALREVREAVAGYRQPTLRAELDGARQMLAAAGIDCVIEHPAEALPPAVDAALAWAAREGTTNIIRHSRARHCTIRVTAGSDHAAIEILNDGSAGDAPVPGTIGSGLSGLAERVAAHSGQLEAGVIERANGRGFRLWVSVPVSSGGERLR